MTNKVQLESQRAEQLRRMRATWKPEQPTGPDVSAAFRRWRMQRAITPRLRAPGVLLAAALSSAATLALLGLVDALRPAPDADALTPQAEAWRPTSAEPAARSAGSVRPSESFLQRGPQRIAARDGLRAELEPAERAVVVVSGVRTELVGPGVVLLRSDASAPGGWVTSFERPETESGSAADEPDGSPRRRATKQRSTRLAVEAAADAAGTDTTSGAWARVAQALRDHDSDKAERALAELARSGDRKTRDAAELARAQLLVAKGRGAEAHATLERLATAGTTPAIKSRAADLLAQIE